MSNQLSPPAARTEIGLVFSEAQTTEALVLQHCVHCHTIQYPPREVCRTCLNDQLEWQATETGGKVLAVTDLHHSHEPYFQQRAPWIIASIKLDCGPIVFAHIAAQDAQPGEQVKVFSHPDLSGRAVLVAVTPTEDIENRKERERLITEIGLTHSEQA